MSATPFPASNDSSRFALRRMPWPVMLILGLGAVFTLTAFLVIQSWERKNIDKAFRLAADERAQTVKKTFDTETAMMELLRAALVADGRIERQEFHEIVAPFLAYSQDIRAVEWVPRVRNHRRMEFEAAARREGRPEFRISEQDTRGQMAPASERDEYYPIFYMGPREDNKQIYGYDVGSEPTRLETLMLARDTGRIVASGKILFVQDKESAMGFFVCLPVYERGRQLRSLADRREHLMGFVLGVFRPSDMIESALARLQSEGIDVGLYDPSDAAGSSSFYVHASRARDDFGATVSSSQLLNGKGMRQSVKLDVDGHPWTVVCAATPEFMAAHGTRWPGVVLVLGLLFTLMAAGYLWSNINHSTQLEQKVRDQTQDIRIAQEEVLFRLAVAVQHCSGVGETRVRRIGLLAEALARATDWTTEEADAIRQAAPLHDIGMIGVPDAIRRKADKLSREEFEVMQAHTRVGADILAGSNVPILKMARDIALNHHERWDGKGYPHGASGNAIPESARIVAIVDAYDTLTHSGPNRMSVPEGEVLLNMQQEADQQFDSQLLTAFFRILPEVRRICERHPDKPLYGSGKTTLDMGLEPVFSR